MREHQYRERYARSLEEMRIEGDEDDNIKHMWVHVKRAIVESTREVCGSVRVGGGGNSKSVWWNDEIKAVVRRKNDAWKEV